MNTKSVTEGYRDILRPSESDSLPLRVIAQLGRTVNQIAHSISNIAQTILSKCIYVGSLGHYTFDDLKRVLFKNQISLESEVAEARTNEDSVMDEVRMDDSDLCIDGNFEGSSNIDETSDEEALEKERKKYGLKRPGSVDSVTSSVYESLQNRNGGIYPDLSQLVKKKEHPALSNIAE